MVQLPLSTWDQWFLRLVYGEHGGAWSALRDRFRKKNSKPTLRSPIACSERSGPSSAARSWSIKSRRRSQCLVRDTSPTEPSSGSKHLLQQIGSRHWAWSTMMAEAASNAGHRDVAKVVFAAADQPGMHRDYLRRECTRLLGLPSLARQTRASYLTILR